MDFVLRLRRNYPCFPLPTPPVPHGPIAGRFHRSSALSMGRAKKCLRSGCALREHAGESAELALHCGLRRSDGARTAIKRGDCRDLRTLNSKRSGLTTGGREDTNTLRKSSSVRSSKLGRQRHARSHDVVERAHLGVVCRCDNGRRSERVETLEKQSETRHVRIDGRRLRRSGRVLLHAKCAHRCSDLRLRSANARLRRLRNLFHCRVEPRAHRAQLLHHHTEARREQSELPNFACQRGLSRNQPDEQ